MGEREGEKHQCVVASHTPPTRDLACNPGMCPTGNRTGDPLVCRLVLSPLSHTSQGRMFVLIMRQGGGRRERENSDPQTPGGMDACRQHRRNIMGAWPSLSCCADWEEYPAFLDLG